MGKSWDSRGVSFQSETWAEVYRTLKPGAHLLAFGGTRTYHRIACAIEDAGFEIRDCIMWLYGTGFPKSLNIGKAIDKSLGLEREEIAPNPNHRPLSGTIYEGVYQGGNTGAAYLTSPASEAAKKWDGWGTALKPAYEPIILARKPLIGTIAENVMEHGTGGIDIEVCRIQPAGRWPANVILDEEAGQVLDEQSGTIRGDSRIPKGGLRPSGFYNIGAKSGEGIPCGPLYDDIGGASRFFYCAKASKKERGEDKIHPTVKPVALMRYLVKLVTPPGGLVLDPFMGSGSTGIAVLAEGFLFQGIEQELEYFNLARQRIYNSLRKPVTQCEKAASCY